MGGVISDMNVIETTCNQRNRKRNIIGGGHMGQVSTKTKRLENLKECKYFFLRTCLAVLIGALLYVGLVATQGHAQLAVNATLRGTVTDSSGADIAGAKVILSEPSTGRVVRQAVSSASGDFEFDELQPGTYVLRCDSSGFKPFEAENILLDPGQIRRVDPVLVIGSTATQVVVSAGAAVMNTESATISETFNAKQNDRTPLVDIYPTVLSLLTTAAGAQGGYGSIVMNGIQGANQTQVFDGIPNDLQGNQNDNSYFFDETQVTTSNAPAESAVPADIGLITHRGSNQIHGVAFYRIFDSVLNASGYFPPAKPPYIQHDWNIAVGGPIYRNRAFFYGEWFAERIPLGTPYDISVPTPAWRNGQFSQTITDPQTGKPFPNNTIPSHRISPVSLAIQNKFYPIPTGSYANHPPVDNYPFVFPFNSDLYKGDWPMGRVDYNLTKTNLVFVRWLDRITPYVLNDGVPNAIWTRIREQQQWAMGDTQIFSSHLDNSFRLGLEYDYMDDGQTKRGQTPPNGAAILSAIGLQGSNPGHSIGQGLPTINISGLTPIMDIPGGVKMDDSLVTLTDSVDWQIGRHVWKFGFITQQYRNGYGFVNDYGTFNFDGSVTGNPYADFLLGIPQSSARTNPLPKRNQYVGDTGIYAQDSYQLNSRLSINYGLRWDYYGTPSAPDHLMYNFDPSTGAVVVDPGGISKVSPLYPSDIKVMPGAVQAISDKTDFAPRFGAAYRVGQNSVVRGGYGIYTARLGNGPNFYNPFLLINPQLGSTGPFSISQNYLNVVTPGKQPLLQFPDPYPASTSLAKVPSQTVFGYPRQESLGKIQQFSGTYEREIGKNIGLRASYIGSRSSGLDYTVNTNLPHPSTRPFTANERPYPQFFQTYLVYYNGSAKFDGLQLEAQRRAGSFTFDANYSLQRSIANFLNTENPYNVLTHWANDGPTQRQYASITMSWTLPFGKGHQYLSHSSPKLQKIAGGWVLTSLTYLGSGTWYSPSFSGSDPSNTGTFGGLPDLVGNPYSFSGGKGKLTAFNDAAFAVPKNGTFGNAEPNSLENQDIYITHLGILKMIPLTHRITFNFQTQISNLFNHPQFLPPSGNISVPGGNEYTSQLGVFSSLERGTPRQITFQGAFVF